MPINNNEVDAYGNNKFIQTRRGRRVNPKYVSPKISPVKDVFDPDSDVSEVTYKMNDKTGQVQTTTKSNAPMSVSANGQQQVAPQQPAAAVVPQVQPVAAPALSPSKQASADFDKGLLSSIETSEEEYAMEANQMAPAPVQPRMPTTPQELGGQEQPIEELLAEMPPQDKQAIQQASAAVKGIIDERDTNKDGVVSPEEEAAFQAKMKGMKGKMGQFFSHPKSAQVLGDIIGLMLGDASGVYAQQQQRAATAKEAEQTEYDRGQQAIKNELDRKRIAVTGASGYSPANIEKQVGFADRQLKNGKWDQSTYDSYIQSVTDPAAAAGDMQAEKEYAKAFQAQDEKLATTLAATSSLEGTAKKNLALIEENFDELGNPLRRTDVVRGIFNNFSQYLPESWVDDGTEESKISFMEQNLRSQEIDILSQMKGKGATFGAMSNAEWDRITAQTGDVKGTLGAIYLRQKGLLGLGIYNDAMADYWSGWSSRSENKGKHLSNFQRDWRKSDEKKMAESATDVFLSEAKVKAVTIDHREKGKADSITTPTTQEAYDALPSGSKFKKPGDSKVYTKK